MTEKAQIKDKLDNQKRKTLIALSGLIGAAASNILLSGNGFEIATAYANSDAKSRKPKLFTTVQLEVLERICQTVIPKTDTPGAGDVDTHGFIDNQLHHCFDTTAQKAVSNVIDTIDQSALARYEKSFSQLESQAAHTLLSDIDLCKNGFKEKDTEQFKFLKYLIVFGYYTSEIGASQELTYDPVPGGFKANIALSDIGSAWGSLGFF